MSCVEILLTNRELKQAAFFESRMETSSEHFAWQDCDLSRIFKVIVCSSENIIGSLSKQRFFEPRTETGSEHFAC